MAGITTPSTRSEDVGAQSTVRRSPSRARQQAGTLMSLAPCPVEGCPVEDRVPGIPASTSKCSLRFSNQPHFPFGNFHPNRVNPPLPQSARNNGSGFPLFRLFQVQISPRLPFWELTPIPVHGYDISSGHWQSGVPVRGARPRAPLTDHDIWPPDSSDSTGDRPRHRRGGGSLRWSRRCEPRVYAQAAARPTA